MLDTIPFINRKKNRKNNSETINIEIYHNDNNLTSLFDNHPDPIVVINKDGYPIYANDALTTVSGYTMSDLKYKYIEYVHKDYVDEAKKCFKKGTKGKVQHFVSCIYDKNGNVLTANITYVPYTDSMKNIIGVYCIIKDMTQMIEIENTYHEQQERIQKVYAHLEVGVWSFDLSTNSFLFISPGVENITGYTVEEFNEFIKWEDIVFAEDKETYTEEQFKLWSGININHEYRIVRKDGKVVWLQDQTLPVKNDHGEIIRIDGIVTEITKHKENEEKLYNLAYFDSITGLFNKEKFDTALAEKIATTSRSNGSFSVLYLDIDRFKKIVATLGYKIANKLLKAFATRLEEIGGDMSCIGRITSDEFGIITNERTSREEVMLLINNLFEDLKAPFIVDDYELFLTVSIGICSYPEDGQDVVSIEKSGEIALSRAKERGKNTYYFLNKITDMSHLRHIELESDLAKSIELNQLLLYFQPRVDTKSGKVLSAEALIRWQHPNWGLVSPSEFIPLAEDTGFINEIGDWVICQVCQYLQDWKKEEKEIIPISINISAQRFLRHDWKTFICDIISKTKVDPAFIEFEITETYLIRHEEEIIEAIKYLKQLGIKVALDDFGTGFSSMSQLGKFPVDTIKIDRSFIKKITEQNGEEILAKGIIYIANGLNKNVVAEGVETLEQLNVLQQLECKEIQGFLFSKPVPVIEFVRILEKKFLKPKSAESSRPIINKRKYYRVDLPYSIEGKMTLTSIQGKEVDLGKTDILIQNIGPGGLKFLSTINLPVRPDAIYQFETTILNEPITVLGHVVWKVEDVGTFQYGIQFVIDEKDRDRLINLFNHLTLHLRKPSVAPYGEVVENSYNYFRAKKLV
ncbi:EAL domain-containing protein [Sutcliffiella cohnii]